MFIKICGISNALDAEYVNRSKADAIGFVMGGSVLPVEVEPSAQLVRSITKRLRSSLRTVLVTHLDNADEILRLADYGNCNAIQISEALQPAVVRKVQKGATGKLIIKTVVASAASSDYLQAVSPYCDYILLDSRVNGYTGGTGVTADWNICRQLVELSERPVLLAGGLTVGNVVEALHTARPAGVDVSTGVSTFAPHYPRKDRKDEGKINAFIEAADAA